MNTGITESTLWPVGLSTCAFGRLDASVFEAYAAHGIRRMEISLPTEKYADLDWKSLPALEKESGVTVWSFHLPFYPFDLFDLSSPDPVLRAETLKRYREYLGRIGDAGIGIAVVHPSGEPNPPEERGDRISLCRESLAVLAEEALRCGVTVAVEDLPRTCIGNCSGEILTLLDAHPALRACFDTNHLLTEDPVQFVSAVGNRIVTLHVSDYDRTDEKHWLPGEGTIDWPALVSALENAGYGGPFLYEVPMRCPKTLQRRDLVPQDYLSNYRSCVNKEQPSPVF